MYSKNRRIFDDLGEQYDIDPLVVACIVDIYYRSMFECVNELDELYDCTSREEVIPILENVAVPGLGKGIVNSFALNVSQGWNNRRKVFNWSHRPYYITGNRLPNVKLKSFNKLVASKSSKNGRPKKKGRKK